MIYTFQILLLGLLSVTALPLCAAEPPADPQPLPNTKPLLLSGDISVQMHEAAHRDMERTIADSPQTRARVWRRDATSTAAYERSILPNRQRFQEIIGLRDSRLPVSMERFGDENNPALVGDTKLFSVFQVRWPVLDGVHGEGLLLEPKGKIQGLVVALPDADQTPEQLVSLAQGVPVESQFARRLAENGFVVIVPLLLDRNDQGYVFVSINYRLWTPPWTRSIWNTGPTSWASSRASRKATAHCSITRWRLGRRPTERAGTTETTCRLFYAAEPDWELSTRATSLRKM